MVYYSIYRYHGLYIMQLNECLYSSQVAARGMVWSVLVITGLFVHAGTDGGFSFCTGCMGWWVVGCICACQVSPVSCGGLPTILTLYYVLKKKGQNFFSTFTMLFFLNNATRRGAILPTHIHHQSSASRGKELNIMRNKNG